MQVGVGAKKEQSDHHCLNNKQPGHDSAHQGDTHLLTERIHFLHQPVTSKRERNKTKYGDKHCYITNPIIMGFCFLVFRGQVMVSSICSNDTATKNNISKNSVNSHWVPQGGMNNVPDIAQEPTLLINSARSLHKSRPGICKIHQHGPDKVEQNRNTTMNPLQEATIVHLIPTIIVNIKDSTLRQEHQRINMHYRSENGSHVFKETREKSNKSKQQNTA